MKRILFIVLLLCGIGCYSQTVTPIRTYKVLKAMYSEGDKPFVDSSYAYSNKVITVNLNIKKITLSKGGAKDFNILRYISPFRNEGELVLGFKCADYNDEACTLYLSYPDAYPQEPTLFFQYENRSYMFYLKEF